MEGSTDSFGFVSESIAREFHAALAKFEPDLQIEAGAAWSSVSDNTKALMITVVKKLIIDEVILPGPQAVVKE